MPRLSHPVETLAASVYHAAHTGLPDHSYDMVDYASVSYMSDEERRSARARESRGEQALPRKVVTSRPDISQCIVRAMFPQTWGSTALGFGGVGGQAMTDAYTVVVEGPAGHCAVYWAGRLAYLVDLAAQSPQQRDAFEQDLRDGRTASRRDAFARYGVTSRADTGDADADADGATDDPLLTRAG